MKNKIKGLALLISLIGIVLINPIGDAIRDNGNKKGQKKIELIRDFLFFAIVAIVSGQLTFVVCAGVSYLAIRTSIHNLAYNLSRKPKLPWWYAGTTSEPDEFERKYLEDRKVLTIILRVFSFAFGIFILYLGVKSL